MKNGRKAFIEKLTELAEKDPKVVLIVLDVGFSFIEEFRKKFPAQYLNLGASEQTAVGVVVGLSKMGYKPHLYTMKNFILLRPLEQVRNDVCYGKANVKLVGVGGSEAYKFLGMSHNLAEGEEEKILSTLPNINSYFPETEEQVKGFMELEYKRSGPAYFAI